MLLFLFMKKAHLKPFAISTSDLGEELDMSQQNVSRRLLLLTDQGYVKRTREGISLTKKARKEIASLYASMKRIFEEGQMEIQGTVTKGIGEGRYYLDMPQYKKQMKKKLGFEPYPGTLNIKIKGTWQREQLLQQEPIIITGFKDKKRTYGDLFAYKCKLENHECALIVPLRTHHGPNILEIVCPFNIRKKLGKKDGQRVKVIIW